MQDRVLLGLTVLWATTAAVSLVIHGAVVCPRLYQNGAKFPTGFLPWRVLRDMRLYRDLCRMASDSLSPYYVYLLLFWFNLIFGIIVGMTHYVKSTSPPT